MHGRWSYLLVIHLFLEYHTCIWRWVRIPDVLLFRRYFGHVVVRTWCETRWQQKWSPKLDEIDPSSGNIRCSAALLNFQWVDRDRVENLLLRKLLEKKFLYLIPYNNLKYYKKLLSYSYFWNNVIEIKNHRGLSGIEFVFRWLPLIQILYQTNPCGF